MPLADDHTALLSQYETATTLLHGRDAAWLTTPQKNVSDWSAAQHLAHVEAVNRSVLGALRGLERAGADAVPDAATRIGLRVLETGTFPRGTIRAPEFAVPPPTLTLADVEAALGTNLARWRALDLDAVPTWRGTLPHPLLGPLTATQWVRFAFVHTAHHHAIVGELV